MNKIDFKNIKSQFDSSINLLDDSIYNGGIFSFSICLDNVGPNQLIANPNFHLDPIFFFPQKLLFVRLSGFLV